jgi:hypothetical protein
MHSLGNEHELPAAANALNMIETLTYNIGNSTVYVPISLFITILCILITHHEKRDTFLVKSDIWRAGSDCL